MRRAVLCSLLLPALAWPAAPAAGQDAPGFKIVVHQGVAADSLTPAAVADLFLKKVQSWPDGQAVVPVEQSASARVRGSFSESIQGRSVAQIESYWRQKLFSGQGVPPVEKSSDAAVLAFVRETPGAIGYVSLEASVAGVKVVRPPRMLESVDPEYPPVARRFGKECVLTVHFRLDEKAVVQGLQASGRCDPFHRDFERAAFEAIRKSRFAPAQDRAGAPVAADHTVTIRFRL
jgi:TonB family protein